MPRNMDVARKADAEPPQVRQERETVAPQNAAGEGHKTAPRAHDAGDVSTGAAGIPPWATRASPHAGCFTKAPRWVGLQKGSENALQPAAAALR